MAHKPSILNSELAVQILSAIASRTDGNYSTNLADELDKAQPSISRILTELHEIGFIEKGARDKVQYYQANYKKISDFWYLKIKQKLENTGEHQKLENFSQNKEKIKELAQNFFQEVLQSSELRGMTLSNLLFNSFAYSIGKNLINNNHLLREESYLEPTLKALNFYIEEKDFCGNICRAMKTSIEETLD